MQWVLSYLAVYHFVLTRKITQIFVRKKIVKTQQFRPVWLLTTLI